MDNKSELRKQAEEFLSRALEYESSGHLEIASQSYVKYADILKELGETEEAKSYYEVADALHPIPLDSRVSLADIYYKTDEISKAVEEYSLIVNLYAEQGLLSSAINLCKKYIDMIPSSSKLQYELADLYIQSGRTQRAINIYLDIINQEKDRTLALEKLGDIYMRRNSIKEAVNSLIKAAEDYIKLEEWERALEQLRKILRLKPDSLSIRKQLIEILIKLDKKKELVNELLVLARDLKNKGKEQMSKNTYSKVLQIDPSNEIALKNLGADLRIKEPKSGIEKIFTGKMSDEVSRSLQSILTDLVEKDKLESKKIDARTHYDMGIAYLEMDLYDEAIHQFQLASKDKSLKVRACNLLGMLFIELGEVELAIKEFKRGLRTYGDEEEHLGVRYNLAMAYKKIGDFDNAIEQLEEIYIVDVEYLDVKEQLHSVRELSTNKNNNLSDEIRENKRDNKEPTAE